MKKTVLFICLGNSGRSRMAEAFFEQLSGSWNGASAGIKPDESIHPWTQELMKEVGIEIGQRTPKLLTSKMLDKADIIVAMDSDVLKQIPEVYHSKAENWNISPLLGKSKEEVRQIRDDIKKKTQCLFREMAES